ADVGQARHGRRRGADRVAADRELAEMIVAPAEHRAVGGDGARERRARRHRRRVLDRRAAAELTAIVGAPAGDGAAGRRIAPALDAGELLAPTTAEGSP